MKNWNLFTSACLALTGGIWGTSKERFYQKLGLKFLRVRRWFKKLCFFYKVLKNEKSQYLFNLIPARRTLYSTRNLHNIRLLNTNFSSFDNSFLIAEWNNLNPALRKSESF